MSAEPILRARELEFTYPGQREAAVRGISFDIRPGEWLWIAGGGGSGKTTLVRLLCGMLNLWPGGQANGSLLYEGREMIHAATKDWAGHIGAVFQDPESGLIHETVEDELAFAPENLGLDPEEIGRRLAEAESFLNIPGILARRISELSGGQQQRVAIASILTMKPRIWLLDDPSANLDAPAAARLMDMLRELHRQGHTICLFSSRIHDRAGADRLLILDRGRLIADGPFADTLRKHHAELVRLGCLPPEGGERQPQSAVNPAEPVLEVEHLSFSYGERTVLQDVNVSLHAGDFLAVTGPNGSGKTTFGKVLAGLLPAPQGTIRIAGRPLSSYSVREFALTAGYAFQNPEHQFVAPTVLEECVFARLMSENLELGSRGIAALPAAIREEGESWLRRFGLEDKQAMHPQALSAAEKRRLALASLLIVRPKLLVLDEPTAGLDYRSADRLMAAYAEFAREGGAAVVITHDLAIVRRYATKELALS